ncbi:MAG TPA: rhomboid family intramembrane serine protease [Terriglobia bacterium]|jgi:membrane associated rhomboid family serine protease|nr:rhomboid family intramembrane serine protease [Terriglobia bacterium]
MVPIPLNDNLRRQTFWFSTLALIAMNAAVFAFELSLGPSINRFILTFGLIPARYSTVHGAIIITNPVDFLVPAFTSMFIHGGWLHLIGNMLFLFVFGRSVEDRFGHGEFLLLYFLSGLGAAITSIFFSMGSRVPTIGASGAIAGVLGAYLISFPTARITTLIPLFFFFWTVRIPALLMLVYWFAIQFVMGYQMLAIESATGGGVAWWAHVGGFILGMLIALVVLKPRRQIVQIRP